MDSTTPKITRQELNTLKMWANGYVKALAQHDKIYQGCDEFYSYNNYWDINFHACSEEGVLYATAYPQEMRGDGNIETITSKYIELNQYNFNGSSNDEIEMPVIETELVHTPRLYWWSDYYTYPTPFTLFLDMIGWNDATYKTKKAIPMPDFGYMELDLIGQALSEYSYNPAQVNEYLTKTLLENQLTIPLDKTT